MEYLLCAYVLCLNLLKSFYLPNQVEFTINHKRSPDCDAHTPKRPRGQACQPKPSPSTGLGNLVSGKVNMNGSNSLQMHVTCSGQF